MSAAQGEVQAGLKGSKGLAAAAVHALRCLVEALDNGDALAFVLPGVASGLAKIMLAAGELTMLLYIPEAFFANLPKGHSNSASRLTQRCCWTTSMHTQSATATTCSNFSL